MRLRIFDENVPPPQSPEEPPLAPYDPPDPAPQAVAWRRAIKLVTAVRGEFRAVEAEGRHV